MKRGRGRPRLESDQNGGAPRITLRIPESLLPRLREYCHATGRKPSEAVRVLALQALAGWEASQPELDLTRGSE